jgi:hypothetical protein
LVVGMQDAQTLAHFLERHQHQTEGESLKKLVSDEVRATAMEAYYEGYELACEVRDRLAIDVTQALVNVLASTTALRKLLVRADVENVKRVAREFEMGFSAVVEHLYNVDLISDADRERLRIAEG